MSFLQDLDKVKNDIRKEVRKNPLNHKDDFQTKKTINLLNRSMATEIVCVHRYKKHYYKAANLGQELIADEFLIHAQEEQKHADMIAKRIAELGGEPEYDLAQIKVMSHSDYKDCSTIKEMLLENLVAERTAVSIYQLIIKHLGDRDPVTRRLLEDILATEEEHVDDLQDFLRNSKMVD